MQYTVSAKKRKFMQDIMYCVHNLLCICITYVYYSVLDEIVCSIHVFALYVDIEFVLLLLCSLTFKYMF